MANSLKQKALVGLFWSAIERFGQQGIQFVVTVIIARILTPADYGVIGMLAIFVAIAQSCVESGFGTALIQKQNATQTDLSTVFYFNIVVSTLIFALLFFAAPLIARFYRQQILIPITRVMALGVFIRSFGLIQNTILTKNISFKTLTKVSLMSIIVSGTVGIYMAYRGFGVWSLAFQNLGATLMMTISLWFFSKWRPALIFDRDSLKSLFSYGSKLLISGLLNQVFNNIYKLIIGRHYSVVDVGFYSQAKRMQEFPVTNLYAIPQRVTFPVYSMIQNETERLKYAYRKTIKGMIFFNFPLMIGLAVLAPLLVRTLLTDKWMPAVIYLQLLCVSGMLYPLSGANLNILKVKGRTDLFLYLQVAKMVFVAIAIVTTLKHGMLIVVMGQVVSDFLSFLVNIHYSGKLLTYTVKEQFLDMVPYLGIAGVMGLVLFFAMFVIPLDGILKLLVCTVIGLALYILLSRIVKVEAFFDVSSFIKSYILTGSTASIALREGEDC